jgi:ketosteroid isomerase-like protein
MSLLLAAPLAAARADETPSALPSAEREAIHGVIQNQLDAFRADDAGAAFGYASPNIQGMFGNAEHFMAMVKTGYPPVYRPRSSAFGGLVEIDGLTVQKVRLVGPDGRAALALYFMEREADGTWKIDGCQLTEDDAVGA